MPVYDLLAAVAAAGIGVGALWLLRRRGGIDRGGPRGDLVTYLGVAGIAALVCAVMNILEIAGGGVTAAAVGNATNVLAAGMLWACARRLNLRRNIGIVGAAAVGLLMLAATFVVTLEDATLVKTGVIALFSLLAATEFRRGTLRHAPGTVVIAIAAAAFGLYQAARLVIAFGAGTEGWVWAAFASSEVTSVASAALILVVSAAALRLGQGLADDPAPGTRAHSRTSLRRRGIELLSARGAFAGLTLRVPDLELIRAAHGAERGEAVMAALVAATADGLPDAPAGRVSRDTIVALLPPEVDRADVGRLITERFASRHPLDERGGMPDIRVVYRGISDRAQLDAFLADAAGRRTRRGQPAVGG